MTKKKLLCSKTFDKKKIINLTEWFIQNYGSIRTSRLLNKIKSIGFKYATNAGLSLGIEDLKVPTIKNKIILKTKKYIKKIKEKQKFGIINGINVLKKEIKTWNDINNLITNEIITNFRQTNLLNPVYMMIYSGARGNITQIKQIIGMRGLMSDSNGEIINSPITSSLKEGLNNKEYFISCYGARKGIIDTALKTANSGYLTRKLIYVAQSLIIKQQDCKTNNGILVKILVKNKKEYSQLKNKIIGRILLENIFNKNKKTLASKGQDICNYIAKELIKNQIYIYTRSVLTCKINLGICQLCYGWNLSNNKIVKIGETIGILAAQSIGEPGTQLTMRTFHTGGIFSSKTNKVISSPYQGKLKYSKKDGKKISNKFGENMFLLLKEKRISIKKNTNIIYKILLPAYSTIFIKPNKKVFEKQIIAEISKWKKKNITKTEEKVIKNYNSGESFFQQTKRKKNILWIKNGQIIIFKYLYRIFNKKKINKKDTEKKLKKKDIKKIKNLIKLNHKNSKKNIKFINNRIKIISTYTYEISKTAFKTKKILINRKNYKITNKNNYKKIVGEITRKNEGLIIGKFNKKNIINKSIAYKIPNKSNITIKNNIIIEKNSSIFNTNYEKEKTKDIVEGLPKIEEILEAKKTRNKTKIDHNMHDKLKQNFEIYNKIYENKIAVRKSIENIQIKLVKQIANVYNSQNITISTKHIEVIIKQITSKVIITKTGDSNVLEGEIFDINKIENINKFLKKKALYEPVLIGISKSSILNESFISAACFQETIRTLSKSAMMGKIDWLIGLKENIILGNLIPAGTGINMLE